MYPALPSGPFDDSGTATLPNGRRVRVSASGHYDGSVNAHEVEDETYCWLDTGDELTLDEINAVVEHGGRTFFLHEFIWEHIAWD